MSVPAPDQRPLWESLTAKITEISEVPEADLRRETRLVEDLRLDSLELVEVIVALFVDLALDGLPEHLQQSNWRGVTVGELFDAYVAHRPAGVRLEWEYPPAEQYRAEPS